MPAVINTSGTQWYTLEPETTTSTPNGTPVFELRQEVWKLLIRKNVQTVKKTMLFYYALFCYQFILLETDLMALQFCYFIPQSFVFYFTTSSLCQFSSDSQAPPVSISSLVFFCRPTSSMLLLLFCHSFQMTESMQPVHPYYLQNLLFSVQIIHFWHYRLVQNTS